MKKWRPAHFDDALALSDGFYVFARHHDEYGPRIFVVANLSWDEKTMSFLSDAATPWGAVPWALAPARACHGVDVLGPWLDASHDLAEPIDLLWQAWSDTDTLLGGLLLLRAAKRLQGLARGQDTVGVDVARHCLREEIERDTAIRQAKEKAYTSHHPDWLPP